MMAAGLRLKPPGQCTEICMELMSETVQPWRFWKLAGARYGGGEGVEAGM